MDLPEVSRRSGLSRQNCSKWRSRFATERLAGLRDRPLAGRSLDIIPEVRHRVIALACTKSEDGSNAWTIRKLSRSVGIGSTSVHRILNERQLKPHKVEYWCGKSPDPEFVAKQAAILGLYLDPPDNPLVLAVDEKTSIRARPVPSPCCLCNRNGPVGQTATYTRHGTTCLLGALAVHEGEVEGRCVERNRHQEFLAFLKDLYRKHPGKHLQVIVNNLATHKHQQVKEWVAKRQRLTLHFTPTYASWLNQVEIWFNIFTRDVIRGGIWHSKKEIVDQIMRYIRNYNEGRAHLVKWTYTSKPLAA